MERRCLLLIALLLIAVTMVGCVANPNPSEGKASADTGKPAGFWAGFWHGMILPITFIWSLFSDKVTIYEVFNNGGWYSFGFWLGIGTLGSGVKVSFSQR